MARYNSRDLIGHFVKPASAAGKMCPHACCRNKRVHPANYPVILPDKLLKRASDDDLAQHYRTTHSAQARAQVLAEMERRDARETRRHDARIRHQRLVAARRIERQEEIDRRFDEAEAATNGYMLNRAGREAGVSERSLFTGPESRARRYASEELKNHWQTHPRPTAAYFRGQDTTLGAQGSSAPRRHLRRRR